MEHEPTYVTEDGAPPASRANEEDATLPDRPLASIPATAPPDAAPAAFVVLDASSSPAAPLLPATPSAAAAAAAVTVKREPGTGESGHNPNQNQQAQFDQIKQEMAMAVHIMNQSAPAASSSPKLLPSISFPPLAPPSSTASSSPPPPLSALAPSLFPPFSSSSSSSSTPSASASSSLSFPPALSSTAPAAMQSRLAPTPSVPLTTPPPSSWEQQTLARLNSLTQMTSQIASIALEKTAAKPETVVAETDKPDSVVEWVTSISRSLQTELQSVYLTLHGGPTESSAPMAVPLVASSAPATTTLMSVPAPTTLPAAILASSPSPPSPSPLSLSPSIPSFSSNPVQAEIPPTSALTAATPPQPNAADDQNDNKKARRRRKTKTKDSFNHMQRKCASCQRTETTKWRHGPLGSNTLCNTCGLAYSRKKKREAEQAAKLTAAGGATTTTPSAAAASTPSP